MRNTISRHFTLTPINTRTRCDPTSYEHLQESGTIYFQNWQSHCTHILNLRIIINLHLILVLMMNFFFHSSNYGRRADLHSRDTGLFLMAPRTNQIDFICIVALGLLSWLCCVPSLSQTLSWSAPDYCYIYSCQNHVTRVVSSSVCPSLIFLMIPVLVWSRVFCGNYTGNSTNANKKKDPALFYEHQFKKQTWCLVSIFRCKIFTCFTENRTCPTVTVNQH